MKTIQKEKDIIWEYIINDRICKNPIANAMFKILKHCDWLELEVRKRQDTIYKLRNELRKKQNQKTNE